eukprot:GDKK01049360.1.p1 GENE.GDKK01049360.1~~GDKK01049360.1.p1  ORF type:complete len:188 (-),score=27.78 GDKK01049360.1:32-595(-)
MGSLSSRELFKVTGGTKEMREEIKLPSVPPASWIVDEDEWESKKIIGQEPPEYFGKLIRRFASVASSSECGLVVVGVKDDLNKVQNFTRVGFPNVSVQSEENFLTLFVIDPASLGRCAANAINSSNNDTKPLRDCGSRLVNAEVSRTRATRWEDRVYGVFERLKATREDRSKNLFEMNKALEAALEN